MWSGLAPLTGVDSADQAEQDPGDLYVQRSQPPKDSQPQQSLLRPSLPATQSGADQGRISGLFLAEYMIMRPFKDAPTTPGVKGWLREGRVMCGIEDVGNDRWSHAVAFEVALFEVDA